MEIVLVSEVMTNGYEEKILNIFYLFAIICGIVVITLKNHIYSLFFLIWLFSSIVCYLMLLGLTFIGLSYLIVYVGAVSILFLFILMLISIRISELQNNNSNSITLILIMLSIYPILNLLPLIPEFFEGNKDLIPNSEDILFVSSNTWDGNVAELDDVTSIGNIMYTNYNIWLIIASFILLLAMIGTIVITKQLKETSKV